MSDGARIYYEMAGEGAPLLLIHGQETDNQGDFRALHSWDPQFAALADHYQTIRFDIRGFGRSSLVGGDPLETFSWDVGAHRTTTDVVELMDHLGIASAHMAGISLGSAMAAQMGVFYPEKIDKLVLVSPWDRTFPDSDSRLTDLEAISHKTALIGGGDDPEFEAMAASLRERAYTPMEKERIPGAGAYPNTEQPEAFNTTVRTFLSEPVPEAYALGIRLSPASPAVLGLGIKVFATFDYVIDHPEGAYIWAKPAATNGGQHHEPSLVLTGSGSVSRYFYLDIPETVTQVKVLMEAPDSGVLYEEILPVSYTWTATP
jgi:pimeloyl-ACP methyl ester carboxylesterase